MNTLLIIAAVWVLCGTLFFIASLMFARDLMPGSLILGFILSQFAWPGFVFECVWDGIKLMFK